MGSTSIHAGRARPLAQAGQPEIREYRIRAVINDDGIGDYSVIKQVAVS